MKKFILFLLSVSGIAAVDPVFGQVEVGVALSHAKVLLHESLMVTVIVANVSGEKLLLSDEPAHPTFSLDIEERTGKLLARREQKSLMEQTVLLPGETRMLGLNVTHLYCLDQPGRYAVRAHIQGASSTFTSPDAPVEVLKGVEVQRLKASGAGQGGRLYSLQYLQRDNSETLFFVIQDETGQRIYAVHDLGRFIQSRPPVIRIDEAGNAHVFFHAPGQAGVHVSFTPMGVRLLAEDFPDKKGRLRLGEGPSGKIEVIDGAGPPEKPWEIIPLEEERQRRAPAGP
ncbi:MAG: hypothetical protein HY343_02975 [Lentisphaerae bacterium]|nr:hypothetical protein [Lentisphaerota bacterium]